MWLLQPPQAICYIAELTLPLKLFSNILPKFQNRKKIKFLLFVLPSKDLEAGMFFICSSLLRIWNLLPPPRPHIFFSAGLNAVSVFPCRSSFIPPDSLHFYCSALNGLTLVEAVPHPSQSVSYPSTEDNNVLSHRCAAVNSERCSY